MKVYPKSGSNAVAVAAAPVTAIATAGPIDFNAPVALEPTVAGGCPYMGFYDDRMREPKKGQLLAAVGPMTLGTPYISIGENQALRADKVQFTFLAEARFYVAKDSEGKPIRASVTKEDGLKELMLTQCICFLSVDSEVRIIPTVTRFDSAKARAANQHVAAIKAASTDKWLDHPSERTQRAALGGNVPVRFRQLSSLVVGSQVSKDGNKYVFADARTSLPTVDQLKAFTAFAESPDGQEALQQMVSSYNHQLSALTAMCK